MQRDALRTGTFTLASGRTSHYYVDGRRVTLSSEGAALIGAGVLDLVAGHGEALATAADLGRDALGFGSPADADIARDIVGMWLKVVPG